jgi:hypothetical protein
LWQRPDHHLTDRKTVVTAGELHELHNIGR